MKNNKPLWVFGDQTKQVMTEDGDYLSLTMTEEGRKDPRLMKFFNDFPFIQSKEK